MCYGFQKRCCKVGATGKRIWFSLFLERGCNRCSPTKARGHSNSGNCSMAFKCIQDVHKTPGRECELIFLYFHFQVNEKWAKQVVVWSCGHSIVYWAHRQGFQVTGPLTSGPRECGMTAGMEGGRDMLWDHLMPLATLFGSLGADSRCIYCSPQ